MSNGQQYTTDFFVYPVSFGNMATGATMIQSLQIQADSNFEWIMSTCYGNLSGTAEPISGGSLLPILLSISDGGSGRNLIYGNAPINSIAGDGKQPFILPQSRIFMARSTVNFTAVSFGAGTFNNIYFNLIGRKIFQLG